MEILVQWLDDIEDFIASILLSWERLRIRCLKGGLIAALILLAIEVANVSTALAPTFALAAIGSVGLWLAALLYAGILRDQGSATADSSHQNA